METIHALSQIYAAGEYSAELLLGMGGLLSAAVLYVISEIFGGIHL